MFVFLKKTLSRATAVILVLCLGCSMLAYFVFDVAQFESRSEAQKKIKAQKGLSILSVPISEFNGGDEIWYHGQLYDVSSYTVAGDVAYVTVMHDTTEEALVAEMVSYFDQTSQYTASGKVHAGKVIHYPSVDKIIAEGYLIPGAAQQQPAKKYLYCAEQYLFPVHTSVIKPPPEFC